MFRFSIRELVLVTVIVAMGLGWYADRHALWYKWAVADTRESMVRSYLERRGVCVRYVGPASAEIGPQTDTLIAKQFHESD